MPPDGAAPPKAVLWNGRSRVHARAFLLSTLWFVFAGSIAAEPLEVLAEDEAAPWSLRDGSGFANEVVRAAFKAASIDAVLHVMPYARCKKKTLNGEAAACFSMSWMPEFEGKIIFSDKPLFICYADYFYRLDSPIKSRSESEIVERLRVGTVVGYEYPPSLYQLRNRGLVELEDARSEELNLKKLALGRVDVALVNYNEIKSPEFLMAQAGVSGKIAIAFRCGVLSSFIGFSAKHPRGAWAREKFNEGFEIIESDGTLQGIRSRWIARIKEETRRLSQSLTDPGRKPSSPPTGGIKP